MTIKKWMKDSTPAERDKLATLAMTSVAYLWQLSGNHSIPGVKMSKKLRAASLTLTPDRPLELEDLRPDIWGDEL